jgi:two-component system CheB/CheR fusion protein
VNNYKKSVSQPGPLVGIGYSAGGLTPCTDFFKEIPSDTELSFVIISHKNPDHKSLLGEILKRHTSLPIKNIKNEMPILPGHIYISPPGKIIALNSGKFEIEKFEEENLQKLPIDIFFKSMANYFEERSIGIILSGTMSDGSAGIKQVKENGGMVIAQEPETAEYPQMPENAINSGLVDLCLKPEEMPQAVLNFVSHPYLTSSLALKNLDDLDQILAIIKSSIGYDLQFYKKNTLIRRILRRMGLKNIKEMRAYIKVLKDNPLEIKTLFHDLLIGVTEFFRDPATWKFLRDNILNNLLNDIPDGTPLRIWVPGCSTGEEAYSLAILIKELSTELNKPYNAQIFATDIDSPSIKKARTGLFPSNIKEQIPAKWLDRYFYLESKGYRIDRSIRESIVFAEQNLISDPPFSELDLISCRNLLIYFTPETQQSITDLFNFALKRNGYLVLGNSETVRQESEKFKQISKKAKVFQVKTRARSGIDYNLLISKQTRMPRPISTSPNPPGLFKSLEKLMHTSLLKEFAPAAVIIDNKDQIIYFFGPTENYLDLPKNEPNFDLFSLLKEGLKTKLRSAIRKSRKHKEEVAISHIKVNRGQKIYSVKAKAAPISDKELPEGLLLVSFTDEPTVEVFTDNDKDQTSSEDNIVKQLEQELQETREDLRNTIKEHETSNEELKASNEEMMSMNEELQSTNEELETSKEELQSLNDELKFLNSKLCEKVSELEEVNDDIVNLINSTEIATVFLDRNLIIRRFTPSAKALFNLIPSDRGRPIVDLNNHLKDQDLENSILKVLDTLIPESKEIESADQRFFLRRIIPFRTKDDRIDGVVLTFFDITKIKKSEQALKISEQKHKETSQTLTAILENTHILTASLDPEFNIIWANKAFASNFNQPKAFFKGKNYFKLYPNAELKAIFLNATKTGKPIFKNSKPIIFGSQLDKGLTYWDLSLIPVKDEKKKVTSLVFTLIEVTDRVKSQIAFNEQAEILKQAQKIAHIGSWQWDIKNDKLTWSDEMFNIFGISKNNFAGRQTKIFQQFVHPEDVAKVAEVNQLSLKTGQATPVEYRIIRPNGEIRTVLGEAGELIKDENNNPSKLTGIVYDITERKQVEEERIKLEKIANRSQKIEALGELAGGIAHNFNNFLCGVFGNIDLALEELNHQKIDQAAEFLENALKSMDPAKALTRQLLTFSRGGEPIKSIASIMPTIIEAAKFSLAGANIQLEYNENPKLWHCAFDKGQISQVINNITLNARQAMAQGGKIKIYACNLHLEQNEVANLPKDDYIRISIEDTGPGIPPKFLNKLFDPFFSTKVGNQGLGLAISYSIIRRHGGLIKVDVKTKESGCVFSIYLPAESSNREKLTDKKARRNIEKRKGKILIMDDEELIRAVLAEMLKKMGFEVRQTRDGKEAATEIINKKGKYDAVILDLTIPGKMGGKEACEILRNSGIKVPIFAASGYSSDPVITTPQEFGFDNSLAKPFSLNELNNILDNV